MADTEKPPIRWKRNLVLLVAIALGVVIIILAPGIKSPPQQISAKEQALKVRAISVTPVDVVPRSVGYGRVVPGRTWEAVAEVAGQVAWVSDELRDGRVVTAGTTLLRIEDANYRLALAQIEAQIQASTVKTKTARDALAIAEKNQALLQSEYDRQKKLSANGTISKTTLEATERQVLAGQSQVETQRNSLELISAEHQVLLAQSDAAQLDLHRTQLVAPFDVRITQVKIGVAQYANKWQLLFSADGLEVAEIEAQFSVGVLRPLIRAMNNGNDTDVRAGAEQLRAIVRLRTPSHNVEWPARVDRVAGTIDPATQTLGVIVAVDRPYASAVPGERPPLLRDTFVEVELQAEPLLQQLIVPVSAVRNGRVYVVNTESRLEIRPVEVNFAQGGFAVIGAGLQASERIVTSDVLTAVDGQLLDPQEDKKSKQQIVAEATGREPKP